MHQQHQLWNYDWDVMGIGKNSSVSGFTLVEVLVATGLLGLLSLTVAVASMAFLKNAQQTSLRFTRDQIVTQLRTSAVNKKNIINSLKKPENVAFYNCVCGVGTCANMRQPFMAFKLYGVTDNEPVQSPAFYTSSGMSCEEENPNCVIRVTTSFFAQCKPDFTSANQNPPLNCDGVPAEFVAIYYTVDDNPLTVDPNQPQLKPMSGPAYIQVADLAPPGSGVCP